MISTTKQRKPKGDNYRKHIAADGTQVTTSAHSWNETVKKMKRKLDEIAKTDQGKRYTEYRRPPIDETQVVDLDLLDDPPLEFMESYKWFKKTKYPDLNTGVKLLDFHFWGIDHHYPTRAESRKFAFMKLFYNMDEQHRVKTQTEFEDVNRDAGPRLLKADILRRLQIAPISRHYPEIPLPGDAWEQQRLAPPRPSLVQEQAAQVQNEIVQAPAPEEVPPNLDQIREVLEKLLIQIRYKDLEIYQGIEKSQPQPRTLKLSFDTDHTFTLNEQGISYPCWELGPAAAEGDSGWKIACDCIMMVGKLLDAGITNIDTLEMVSRPSQTNNLPELLINAVMINWGSPDLPNDTAGLRENFHANFLAADLKSIQDLVRRSTLLRKQFEFSFENAEFCEHGHKNVVKNCLYRWVHLPNGLDKTDIQDILQNIFDTAPARCIRQAELSGEGVSAELRPKCSIEGCQKYLVDSRLSYNMPLRLAIYPPRDTVMENHTSDDIRFEFINGNGEKETAVYRWLGGIYSDTTIIGPNTRHRVFWTDAVRGGRKENVIRMYDPCLYGYYIGGIKPAPDGSLIPPRWQPSVVFYEAVLNPNPVDLTVASAVLGDMWHAMKTGQTILQHHVPWSDSAEGIGLRLETISEAGALNGATPDLRPTPSMERTHVNQLLGPYRQNPFLGGNAGTQNSPSMNDQMSQNVAGGCQPLNSRLYNFPRLRTENKDDTVHPAVQSQIHDPRMNWATPAVPQEYQVGGQDISTPYPQLDSNGYTEQQVLIEFLSNFNSLQVPNFPSQDGSLVGVDEQTITQNQYVPEDWTTADFDPKFQTSPQVTRKRAHEGHPDQGAKRRKPG